MTTRPLAILILSTAVCADAGPREDLARANELIQTETTEAISLLTALDTRIEESDTNDPALAARIKLALGIAQLKDNQTNEAIATLREADLTAAEPEVAARARFNLGHAFVQAATAQPDPNTPPEDQTQPQERLDLLRAAAAAFSAARDLDPTDEEAARNTELARRMIRAMQQEIERQQQRSEAMQDLAERLQDLAEQQQNQSEQSRQSDPEQSQELSEQQQALQNRTEQAQQELQELLDQSQPGDPGQEALEQAMEQLQQAGNSQKQAQQDLQQQSPGQASQDQSEAAQQLADAAAALAEASDESNPGEPSDEQSDSESEGDPQDQQQDQQEDEEQSDEGEPDPNQEIADQLLEREERLREARQEAIRSYLQRQAPTEKDW